MPGLGKPVPGVIYLRRGGNVGGLAVRAGEVRAYPENSLDT